MYEIRIHGRGGQGGVTSSIMGTLAASKDGKFAQALQIYGAERRGAPVVASLRIGDGSSRLPHHQVYHPDCVVVLDKSLFRRFPIGSPEDMLNGLKDDGWVIINAPSLEGSLAELPSKYRVAIVDATSIAESNGLSTATTRLVNTAILGAIAYITNAFSVAHLESAVQEKSPAKKEANVAAVRQSYENTKVIRG